ncbi:MAG TPA: HAMP domain-containing sensor histidine kinase [Bdellovibrionales bacterium]|nr:HAMP domain-containing sensor histidine kinase [Bdellovibrionales bacterium]
MHFSCKISNSVLRFFDEEGLTKEFLYTDSWSAEFLRDPSFWLDARDMEAFLKAATKQIKNLEDVGHRAAQLQAWGPLDSVLRLVESPQEMMAQPERFLSYFISPPPPVAKVKRSDDFLSFETPISEEEFPLTTAYLKSAIEALPSFVGRPFAQARWSENRVDVNWSSSQGFLFEGEPAQSVLNPKLMQSLVASLEHSQRELEKRNKELLLKNEELQRIQKQKYSSDKLSGVSELAMTIAHQMNHPMAYVSSNVLRLEDYLQVAQQAITNFKPKTVSLDFARWKEIEKEFPIVVKETLAGLNQIREIVREVSMWTGVHALKGHPKVPTDVNQIINRVVDGLQPSLPSGIRIDRHLFLDRHVPVLALGLEQVLVSLIQHAAGSIDKEGSIRISTMPTKNGAKIEVADTGPGMDELTRKNVFNPFSPSRGRMGLAAAQTIVAMHDGDIWVESEPGRGSVFKIELPVKDAPKSQQTQRQQEGASHV